MQRDLILTRDLRLACEPLPLPQGMTVVSVRAAGEPAWEMLCGFCAAHRFPADWPGRMLSLGGTAYVLVGQEGEAVGTGWTTGRPFYIDEIARSFDPGEAGMYFFGDLITPAYRGQRLHRHLIRVRVDASRAAGRQWGVALTRADNLPSLGGYRREGFTTAAELHTRRRGGWRLDTIRGPLAAGRLSTEGLLLPGLGRLRRV